MVFFECEPIAKNKGQLYPGRPLKVSGDKNLNTYS